ncbi:MAG: 30S ribosomal protein S5 [Alphaproteobacteria bacterium]|nr:30S ribosomal protein S5 [Alphaproteobacteria bacterium]
MTEPTNTPIENNSPTSSTQAPAQEKGRSRTKHAEARRRSHRSQPRQRSEFDRKVLSARRVTRVVAGGRRMSLAVAVAVGDKQGRVGIGTGKGLDMASATEKALTQAKKNMIRIPLTKNGSIPHDVSAKYCASSVILRPSQSFVAGGAVRVVASLAGIKGINAKILSRSKNAINNAQATIKALQKFTS